jgi:indolepyruvate decarboxylase
VAQADLVLHLGAFLTDVDLASQPLTVARHRSIWAMDDRVEISFHGYPDVPLADFVRGLLKTPLRAHRGRLTYHDNLPPPRKGGDRITMAEVLQEVNRFLRGRREYLVTADSGDAIFAGLEVRMSGMATYLAQGYYASMGFAVPGALGAQMGTGLRPLVLCGDGAFQMTGYEIAHAPRYGLTPVVVLLNNGGWGIFQPLATRPDLLALPSWRYAALARLWGGAGYEAGTAMALREALQAADRERRFVIIEVPIAPGDLSPLARRYFTARRGPRRPR